MVSTNFEDFNLMPRRPLSCVVPIITDVAEVNPTVTGIEIKSTNTPRMQIFSLHKNI